MKLDLLLPFTLLLNNTYNRIVNNFVSTAVGLDSSTSNNVALPEAQLIRVPELNEDVLHSISDDLDLAELIEMAATSTRFRFIAQAVFRRRYRSYDVEILKTNMEHADDEKPYYIYDNDQNQIQINDYKMAINLLRYFGHELHQLKIVNYNFQSHRSTVINRLANKYGSESISALHLSNVKSDTFEQFTKPFNKVEILTCFISSNQSKAHTLSFDQMFPNLQQLFLTLSSDIEYELMNRALPNLRVFNVAIGISVWRHTERIEEFLRKNPQIREIEISFFPTDFVTVINECLPNLESLSLDEFHIDDETIRFENVKKFVLHNSNPSTLNKISFARLESLEMIYDDVDFDDWAQFFTNHSNLSRLHLEGFEDDRLAELMAKLPNLIEITIEWNGWISVEDISEIIRNHAKLMTFKLNLNEKYDSEIGVLQNLFEDEWIISTITYGLWTDLSFERKKSND